MSAGTETPQGRELPQLDDLFLTDGGLETVLIFHRGIDLPEFASFGLVMEESGAEAIRDYYEPFLDLAAEKGLGFILETPTWRASDRWGERLGYSSEQMAEVNRRAVDLISGIRDSRPGQSVVVSGCIGPLDDGYDPETMLSAEEAEALHSPQVGTFAEAGTDMVSALTMTYVDEAVGVARAAQKAGMPIAVSFTVETDGSLPDGTALGDAIAATDEATGSYPAYYMINCAHPTHFDSLFEEPQPWHSRIRGLRANSSKMSHAELDEMSELDEGDPEDLGARHGALRERLPHLTVLGGCCGTDHRHVAEICTAWIEAGK